MIGVLAAVRPDEWNFPLLVHVLGAMVLVGGLATAAVAQVAAWPAREARASASLARMAFRALLLVAVPGWIVMRVGAEWIASEEGLDGDRVPTWVDVGYVTAEPGGVLLLAATVLAGLGARRIVRDESQRSWLVRVSIALIVIILVAYLVVVWAMTAKPG